jgi:hypothetical protein
VARAQDGFDHILKSHGAQQPVARAAKQSGRSGKHKE